MGEWNVVSPFMCENNVDLGYEYRFGYLSIHLPNSLCIFFTYSIISRTEW